jgi:DNA-binding GntR family transcriptional regulator
MEIRRQRSSVGHVNKYFVIGTARRWPPACALRWPCRATACNLPSVTIAERGTGDPVHVMPGADGGNALLTDRVYSELRELIFRGDIPAGQPLSIPALAVRLQVSRSPVREAVQRLIYEGVATQIAYAGARVAILGEQAAQESLLIRELLEGLAARQAAENVSGQAVSDLELLLREQDLGGTNGSALTDERAFHRRILDLSANSTLAVQLERLDLRSRMIRPDPWQSPAHHEIAVSEHRGIVEAIVAGDPAEAESRARRHVANLRVRLNRTQA